MDDRKERVRRNVERLRRAELEGSYNSIAQELTRKRLDWYERNKVSLGLEGSDVRKAYTLLLIRYLGLDPKEVPVVYEDEERIVWRSHNFCPLLEACKEKGRDTRVVCSKLEAPAQALVSKVSPTLRFSRKYATLRPYGAFCEEMIERR
ncbi:MAG: hypothetical protein ABSG92_02590 [Conexivisphaerales archaeon]